MTVSAEQLRDLMALGIEGERLLAVVRIFEVGAAELSADSPLELRRAKDRERKRRHRLSSLPESEWTATVAEVLRRDNHSCAYCGSTEKLTADHIVPLSREGTNNLDNLCACCRDCNLKKGNKLVSEWLPKGVGGKQTMSSIVRGKSAELSADSAEKHCDLSSLSLEIASNKVRKKEVVTRARGTRLSPNAKLSDADRQFARDEGMSDGQVEHTWTEFVDYWISVPGQRGTKLNWSATWRNRVRDVIGGKYGGTRQNGSSSATRSRAVAQDAIVAGMAAALSERPDSRLGGSCARGRGDGKTSHPDDPAQRGSVAGSLFDDRGKAGGTTRGKSGN